MPSNTQNTKNNWKRWSVVGLVVAGTTYTGVCLWGNLHFLNDLETGAKVLAGLGEAAVSAVCFGLAGTAKYYCERYLHRKKMLAQLTERLTLNSSNTDFNRSFSQVNQGMYRSLSMAFPVRVEEPSPQKKWAAHAIKCALLVNEFLDACPLSLEDHHIFLNLATKLREEYPHDSDLTYYAKLKSSSFDFEESPVTLIERYAEENFQEAQSTESLSRGSEKGYESESEKNSRDDPYQAQSWKPSLV